VKNQTVQLPLTVTLNQDAVTLVTVNFGRIVSCHVEPGVDAPSGVRLDLFYQESADRVIAQEPIGRMGKSDEIAGDGLSGCAPTQPPSSPDTPWSSTAAKRYSGSPNPQGPSIRRVAARSEARTRGVAPTARAPGLLLIEPDSAVGSFKAAAKAACHDCIGQPPALAQQLDRGGLAAWCGWPVRTPFGGLVRALPVVVSSKGGACCLSLVGPHTCWRVGGTRDIPVEALFPQGRERFELASSGWSRVLGIDAVGGAPHCDLADEGGARVASRCSPYWRAVTLAGVVLDLVGEVGD
jgi:hypothetical protein